MQGEKILVKRLYRELVPLITHTFCHYVNEQIAEFDLEARFLDLMSPEYFTSCSPFSMMDVNLYFEVPWKVCRLMFSTRMVL